MELPIWHINAFTSQRFCGNPAAVVPLTNWLPDEILLSVAAENNLSETAFFTSTHGDPYDIRWFTPKAEVPLCGHATLASAWVLLNHLTPLVSSVEFSSKSGHLSVFRSASRLVMDFPVNSVETATDASAVIAALGKEPQEIYSGLQWMAVYRDESDVSALTPDFERLRATGIHGVIVTAPGSDCDFVSRFFAPAVGVPEDPVTGSAHTRLVPYWAKRHHRQSFYARQISARGGELWCDLRGDRVHIAGNACLYLQGKIAI